MVRAKYDNEADDESELSFKVGDFIVVEVRASPLTCCWTVFDMNRGRMILGGGLGR